MLRYPNTSTSTVLLLTYFAFSCQMNATVQKWIRLKGHEFAVPLLTITITKCNGLCFLCFFCVWGYRIKSPVPFLQIEYKMSMYGSTFNVWALNPLRWIISTKMDCIEKKNPTLFFETISQVCGAGFLTYRQSFWYHCFLVWHQLHVSSVLSTFFGIHNYAKIVKNGKHKSRPWKVSSVTYSQWLMLTILN